MTPDPEKRVNLYLYTLRAIKSLHFPYFVAIRITVRPGLWFGFILPLADGRM